MFGKYGLVLKNASYLTLFEVMRMAMPFIALPYLFRVVGEERYGTVVFAQAIVALFALFIHFGLDISAVRDVAIYRNNRERLNQIFSAVIFIKSTLALLVGAVLALAIHLIPALGSLSTLILYAFIACLADIFLPVWYYQGCENMKVLTIVRFLSIAFYTAALFLCIHREEDYPLIALLQSLGLVVSAVVSCGYVFLHDRIRLRIPPTTILVRTFRDSVPFFASRASLAVNTYMAKIMSGVYLSGAEVAAFDVAQKVLNGGMVPIQMLNQALYPNISRTRDRGMVRSLLRVVTLLVFGIAAVLFTFAEPIVRILSHGELTEATGKAPDQLNLVGGGARNRLLCDLTAQISGVTVVRGPIEASTFGSLLAQLETIGALAANERASVIAASAQTHVHTPRLRRSLSPTSRGARGCPPTPSRASCAETPRCRRRLAPASPSSSTSSATFPTTRRGRWRPSAPTCCRSCWRPRCSTGTGVFSSRSSTPHPRPGITSPCPTPTGRTASSGATLPPSTLTG